MYSCTFVCILWHGCISVTLYLHFLCTRLCSYILVLQNNFSSHFSREALSVIAKQAVLVESGVTLAISLSLIAVSCGDPGTPQNGRRTLAATTFASNVTYECSDGYMLEGPQTRQCLSNRQWSNTLPRCDCEL